MSVDKNKILKKAISIFGEPLQHVIAMEECSELIKEISKGLRGEGNEISMVEEIADVLIMIDQLKLMHHISDKEIEDEIEFKLLRINGRLQKELED